MDISNHLTSLRQILSQNMKKLNNVKSGQSADDLFSPTWKFWEKLQFLLPMIAARPSRDTLKPVQQDKTTTSTSETGHGLSSKKRQKLETTKEELMRECIKVMQQPEHDNNDTSFGLYVANKLATFDRKTRMFAEKRITDILWESEMEVLHLNSSSFDYSGGASSLQYPQYPAPVYHQSASSPYGH